MSDVQMPKSFYELFDASLPRLGPGDDASTRKALKTLLALRPPTTDRLRIIDVGCGNGAPTIQLARHTNGTITAVDNHEPYLQELQRRAAAEGLSDRINVRLQDMGTLSPDMGIFDLVWSEGALFVMGFRKGLAACYDLLVPGGLMAATELCWLRPDPPEECRSYFEGTYPDITTVETNLAAMRDLGYVMVDHFTLPESAWWDAYFTPIEARLHTLRKKYAGDGERTGLFDSIQEEIDVYRKYSSYYGYVFYLMRRP